MAGIRMIIGGDLVPTPSNAHLFNSGDAEVLLGEVLLGHLSKADFRVVNLEAPLADQEAPILKNGPNLLSPASAVKGIAAIGINLVSLANNHCLDNGEHGLFSTLKTLQDNGIDWVGAGPDLQAAAEPYIFAMNGLRIGFYACAEHEFSIAAFNGAGANPFDPLESLDHVSDLKKRCDYVTVLYHGGRELYRYPSPDLQVICRKLAEKGADLILCQHSHCIGAFEQYQGSMIVYGQGNFLFDYEENEFTRTALLIDVEFTATEMMVGFLPLIKQGNVVRMADNPSAAEILASFRQRSEQILDEALVQSQYDDLALEKLNGYLAAFMGNSLLFRVMNKLSGHRLTSFMYSPLSLTRLRNYIECEAHRELILAGLKKHLAQQDK